MYLNCCLMLRILYEPHEPTFKENLLFDLWGSGGEDKRTPSHLFILTLSVRRQSGFTNFNISIQKRNIYNPRAPWPPQKTVKHCWFTFSIHKHSASSGTTTSQLKTWLSLVFIVGINANTEWQGKVTLEDLIMLWWKGTWGNDSLPRGLKLQEWSCNRHWGPDLH